MTTTPNLSELFARPDMPFTTFTDLPVFLPTHEPWIIQNLLPVGLTLLSGDPRSGKSSLALQLMLDIATATPPFATQDPALDAASQYLRPFYGTIFYLALESSALRLQEIYTRLTVAHPDLPPLTNLNITNTWKPFTASEGLHDLCDWLRSYPDTRLLVIDNLASLRPLFKGNDRELLSILRRLAEQLQISILLLHTCKRSSPLVSQVDHHLHLKRLPVSTFYLLSSLGSLLQPTSYLLHCPSDLLSFRIAKLDESLALTTLSAHKTLTPERLALLRLFHDYGSFLTPTQVSAALQLDYDCTRQLLSKMAKASLLTASRGRYTLHPAIRLLIPSLLTQYPFLPKITIAHIPPTDPEISDSDPEPSDPDTSDSETFNLNSSDSDLDPSDLDPETSSPPQPPPTPLHLMPPPNLPALLHPKPQSLTTTPTTNRTLTT
ncbi:AAA family ATPase [Ktedonobacter sp. SOSP1-52]|uniref:AAA family ATPase n=1 Tax=Ktedonobacter sp. SOSP1-52 TaxID=2778366 RepID=UPI001F38D8D4|nr:AAA family ATPase [Ktedonobacter sp. SOSP1-52]